MAVDVKKDFSNTKKLVKNFKNIKKIVFNAGTEYERYIEKQWKFGKNGKGQSFKPLTEEYKKIKSKTRSSRPDLELTGRLIKTLSTNMNSDLEAKIFLADETKAKWVAERNDDVGLWDITTKKARKILAGIYKRLQPR